ncbi:50S ribosomal protein L22 [Candidatus Woesearchaeota archaeon]|nr:50S ribosomal protein L22 [Candidatus Woesearchaeota archaeon]
MSNFRYSFRDYDKNNMARVAGLDLAISTKHSIEISSFIRGMDLQKAKRCLEDVISKKKAVPFRRFNMDMGHKKGIGPGRYPVKAGGEFLKLLLSVEANAQSKGLNTGNLTLVHVSSHQASRPMKPGRHRGRVMKRSHVEIVVKEAEVSKERRPRKQKAVKNPEAPGQEENVRVSDAQQAGRKSEKDVSISQKKEKKQESDVND